ncbi:MAG: PIN domain-containing protein [Gaiellaceae bacterium]
MSCVLDADVVIAHIDDRDAHHRAARRALAGLSDEALLISMVNYAEVLVQPSEGEETLAIALKAIARLDLELVAPTPAIARDAARFRAYGISLPDCFALATARARGATVATFDRDVRRAVRRAGVKLAPGVR